MKNICKVEGCQEFCNGQGYCKSHYMRFIRHGNPLAGRRTFPNIEARFWAKVNKDGPIPSYRPDLGACWLWTASINHAGYGTFGFLRIGISGHCVIASHYAYVLAYGEPNRKGEVDHLCRVPACVNPSHLEFVTHRENMLRGHNPTARNSKKTHCPKGHAYIPDNIYMSQGSRKCRSCSLARDKRYRQRLAMKQCVLP